jgi:hypothetical protein
MRDPSWITILASLLLIRWLAVEALAERAIRRGAVLLFRAPLGLRLLFGFCIPGFVYGAASAAAQNFRANWWLSATFLFFAVFTLAVWPADIGISASGVFEHKYLGLQKRAICWEDAAYAATDPGEKSVTVGSKAGLEIRHTKYHVDRFRFVEELRRRKLLEPVQRMV